MTDRDEPEADTWPASPELLTVAQAATRLRVTPDTVRRWARNGHITAARFGGQWRVPATAIDERVR